MERQRGNDDFEGDRLDSTGQRSTGDAYVTARDPHGSTAHGNGDAGMVALSYIMSGVILYGGLGWLAARWLGHQWLIAVGLILGMVASTYMISRRFGTPPAGSRPSPTSSGDSE